MQIYCRLNYEKVCMYVCMYSPARKQHTHIIQEGQQGTEALTAARNKKVGLREEQADKTYL